MGFIYAFISPLLAEPGFRVQRALPGVTGQDLISYRAIAIPSVGPPSRTLAMNLLYNFFLGTRKAK
ncbi:hypothetical protein NG793_15995 [Laspinema sp. C5]|nr:hypothetical protein [Laspinema sp. D3c]